jgi:putative transcriptional regulator
MIKHHPKPETLADFAAGTLDEGRALVVAEHVVRCAHCRTFVSGMEHIGGQMLMRSEPAAMSANAREQAISRLDSVERSARPTASAKPLDAYPLGPWRWIAPGLRWRSVTMPGKTPTRVFLLKAAPGTKLPSHSHTGTELTTVLSGAFIHDSGRFGAGDCDDADQDDAHSPVVDVGEECICIVAMQGTIRLQGMIGRLIQPFIRL